MSELYNTLLKNRDPLQKAKLYAVLKNINERDVRNRETNNVSRAVAEKCAELNIEGSNAEMVNKVLSTGQNFRYELSALSKKIDYDLIKEDITNSIKAGPPLREIKTDTLITWAQILSLILVTDNLKTSQIRKFLSGVRGVEAKVNREKPENFSRQEAAFLKVHLAYAKSRNDAVKPLMDVMTAVIDKIQEKGLEGLKDFKIFVRFVEAVVAYHRFYGGAE